MASIYSEMTLSPDRIAIEKERCISIINTHQKIVKETGDLTGIAGNIIAETKQSLEYLLSLSPHLVSA